MSLHDEYLQAQLEANKFATRLYHSSTEHQIALIPTAEGMKIETRTPSGSGDIVHHMYLTRAQCIEIYNYVQKIFINKSE